MRYISKKYPDRFARALVKFNALNGLDYWHKGQPQYRVSLRDHDGFSPARVTAALNGRPGDLDFVIETVGVHISDRQLFWEDSSEYFVYLQANPKFCLANKGKEKAKMEFAFGLLNFWRWYLCKDLFNHVELTTLMTACIWYHDPDSPIVRNWLAPTNTVDPRSVSGPPYGPYTPPAADLPHSSPSKKRKKSPTPER